MTGVRPDDGQARGGGEPVRPRPYPAGTAGPAPLEAPATARRSRTPFYGGVLLIGVLIVLAVVLSRWLGPTLLDTNQVERDVAAQFEERYGVAVDVECPELMRIEEGQEYDCDAETADREDLTLVISITDQDEAAYTWDVD